MPSFTPWMYLDPLPDLDELEDILQDALTPVIPRARFVEDLRARLVATSPGQSLSTESSIPGMLLIVMVGVVSGTVLILAGVRALVTLLAGLGVIHQMRHQLKAQRQSAPVEIARRSD